MQQMVRSAVIGLVIGVCVVAPSLASAEEAKTAGLPAVTKAVAVLRATKGNNVSGIVTFTKEAGGVRVVATVEGLMPGAHGFHIHAYGDCSASDAASAGGHFNPENTPHGGPDAEMRHAGDLGNIQADESGRGSYDRLDSKLSLDGPHSIIGYGVIVHEKVDDLTTQPTGAAGGRVACGAIGVAKP